MTVVGVASSPIRPLRVAVTACTRLGPHDAEHVDAERRLHHPAPQRGQRRGGRRVAGDDEQLRAAREELLGDLQREGLELGPRALAVGEARGVAQVEEVLVGQRDEQLVQDGEAADAGVEDGDRPVARIGGSGRHGAGC